MNLTLEEKGMLDGKYGNVMQKCMELLVAIGDSYDAERMIPISSAHLVSANPVTAGKGGSIFIKEMAEKGGKFLVFFKIFGYPDLCLKSPQSLPDF